MKIWKKALVLGMAAAMMLSPVSAFADESAEVSAAEAAEENSDAELTETDAADLVVSETNDAAELSDAEEEPADDGKASADAEEKKTEEADPEKAEEKKSDTAVSEDTEEKIEDDKEDSSENEDDDEEELDIVEVEMEEDPLLKGTILEDRFQKERAKFPGGWYWNHQVWAEWQRGDNLLRNWNNSYGDSITTTPCATHNGQPANGQYDCNAFDGAIQCKGYANKVFYDLTGEHVAGHTQRTDKQNLSPGDFVSINGGGHFCVVIAVDNNGFTAAECNLDRSGASYNCMIRWDHYYEKKYIDWFVHADNYASLLQPLHTHSYTSKVTKAATCKAAGVRTYTCSCGNSYTEAIAKTSHKYKKTKVVAPTKKAQGYTIYTCTVCGAKKNDDYVDPAVSYTSWTYSSKLPSGITSDRYIIEYKGTIQRVQETSPGSGWKKTSGGSVWQNVGGTYEEYTTVNESDTKRLVGYYYYHFCGGGAGNRVNYAFVDPYNHFDSIRDVNSVSIQKQLHDDDSVNIPCYILNVGCQSGSTCDGAYGSHGSRSNVWYRMNIYQNRQKVTTTTWTKQTGWTSKLDSSATNVTYRYKKRLFPTIQFRSEDADAAVNDAGDLEVMYRLYNPNSGEHFYTASAGEKNHLVKSGWKYEGVGWIGPKKSTAPVYRLYNANAGDHHYTTKKSEKNFLVKNGWKYEGIGWYSDVQKRVPLYRQYNPNAKTGTHNYTVSKSENDYLVKLGWKAEGIGWYGTATE
ncbi:MAG: hypothetical protein Q4B22_03075 [Eubacteriales bacterium]|nr:hypothetical protein [Eubacteriales bacterium]